MIVSSFSEPDSHEHEMSLSFVDLEINQQFQLFREVS